MRDLNFFSKIFIAVEPVDFRRQAQGLALLIENRLQANLYSKRDLFVFTNKSKTAVKCVYWDQTGLAMWWKTLEKESFRWPKPQTGQSTHLVTAKELNWLLEGIDLFRLNRHKKIDF